MTDPMQEVLRLGLAASAVASPNSRYSAVGTAKLETAEGKTVVYLRRRFVPPPQRFATLGVHVVTQGDRLDNLAAQHLGEAELFWRLCDANRALRPEELEEEIGRRLHITLPEGLQGTAHG